MTNLHYNIRIYLCFLLWFVNLVDAQTQQKNTRFSYYKIDDGLSQNMVECMLKDSHGFMWFGTWNGLNRFDSYEFSIFKKDGTEQSLSDNFIYALEEDHFGNIWIGTDKGLNIYHYEDDRILLPWMEKHSPGVNLFHGRITALLRDHENNIWLGTEHGINVLNVLDDKGSVNLKFSFGISDFAGTISSAEVNTIYTDNEQKIWIGTNDGLFLFNYQDGVLLPFQSQFTHTFSNNVINAIYKDKLHQLWIGTYYGLHRLNMSSGELTTFLHIPTDPSSLAHSVVRDIIEDYHGNITVATLGGVSVFNESSQSFSNFKESPGNNYGLNNVFVSCLLSDQQGNVWIATENGGVNRYNLLQNQFSHFEKSLGDIQGLSHHIVNSVFDDNNYIWIGTAGGGLNRYDKRSQRFVYYTSVTNQSESLSNNFVTSIYRASNGRLYIGTWGGGLNRLENERQGKGSFYQFPISTDLPNALPDAFISSLAEDRFGYLWVGAREGLARIHLGSGNIDQFTLLVNNRPLLSIGALEFDCEGNLWVATLAGLYKIMHAEDGKIDINKSKVMAYFNEPGNKSSLSSNFIISIHRDQQCNMWFGNYGNGFSRLIKSDIQNEIGQFLNYNETDGLSNNVVYGILADNSGNLWMSTDYGLSHFNTETGRFKNYYTSDGLKNNQYYWSASHRNKNGTLYFGGVNGLNFFSPDSLYEKIVEPSLIINEFRINNRVVKRGEKISDRVLLNRSIINTQEIVMSYKVKEFTFGFTALIYDQPKKLKYAYKLQGYDHEWTEVDASRRFASYMNLPGGQYTFLVRATDSNNNWSTEPIALQISIIPPFYTTTWFILLMIMMLVALIISYNRYKLYSMRLQKQTLEKKVTLRTALIESQKEKLLTLSRNLNESLVQLKESDDEIREQNRQLEAKNQQIQLQKDKLSKLHEKVHLVNQQQLNFFTNISHEFRTSLSLITSPLEQLLKHQLIVSNKGFKSNLDLIQKNAGRLLRLINQLMDIRKIESGNLKLKCAKGDIVPFIRDIAYSFSPLSDVNKIELSFSSSPAAIDVYFDNEKIENIIYNLISNAFKYTARGGNVQVMVRQLSDIEKYENGYGGLAIVNNIKKNHAYVEGFTEIIVKDTGMGIDPQKAYNIFQRFSRLETPGNNFVRGTGIGLYLTKELASMHKGSLFLESFPEKGSTFVLLLPMGKIHLNEAEIVLPDNNLARLNNMKALFHADEPLLQPEQAPKTYETQCQEMGFANHILIVEDNNELRGFIKDALAEKFKVTEAANGLEGTDKALEHLPDLILSDIMMPVMDGLALCKKIKQDPKTSHIPIILLTARSEKEQFIEGLETGADDYITKPFSMEMLYARIQSLVKNRILLKEAFRNSIDPIPKNVVGNKQNQEFLEKTVKYIEKELANPELNVQTLANELCISRSLLHKKLTAISGQSANDFITSIRLKKSLVLLLEHNGNIADVAYDVGFNDPKYFSRCFKKYFNLSPTEYLNKTPKTDSDIKIVK